MQKRTILVLLAALLACISLYGQGAKPVGENSYSGTILSITDENGIFEFVVQDQSGKNTRFIPTADCQTILPLSSYRTGDTVEISEYSMVSDTIATVSAMRWITPMASKEWDSLLVAMQTPNWGPDVNQSASIEDANIASAPDTTEILEQQRVFADSRLIVLIALAVVFIVAVVLLVVIIVIGQNKRKEQEQEQR
ncbi:MAG: hypothetical protein WCS18_11485 [Sphaerochaetaceae bacterium]